VPAFAYVVVFDAVGLTKLISLFVPAAAVVALFASGPAIIIIAIGFAR